MVAVPESHPLGAREAVYWIDLKDDRLLLSWRDPGPELQDLLVAKLASPGDRPNIVRHDVSRESLESLVGAGFGRDSTDRSEPRRQFRRNGLSRDA